MKLVINSNKNYSKPLIELFKSLIEINFTNFKEIILVLSGSDSDESPQVKKVSDVLSLNCEEEICVIKLKQNNYDYSGYQALFLFKDHELVKSESYFYTLDTVTFNSGFIKIYNILLNTLAGSDLITTCPGPHSNICAFGNKLIDLYKNNFETLLTKDEAIRLEHELPVIKNEKEIKGIVRFGKYIPIEERIFCGERDIYNTGYPRQKFLYKSFDLYKWIMFHFNGDITKNLTQNNPNLT